MATAIETTYSYPFASEVETTNTGKRLSLATCDKE